MALGAVLFAALAPGDVEADAVQVLEGEVRVARERAFDLRVVELELDVALGVRLLEVPAVRVGVVPGGEQLGVHLGVLVQALGPDLVGLGLGGGGVVTAVAAHHVGAAGGQGRGAQRHQQHESHGESPSRWGLCWLRTIAWLERVSRAAMRPPEHLAHDIEALRRCVRRQ